jgi:TatD DNase family protein
MKPSENKNLSSQLNLEWIDIHTHLDKLEEGADEAIRQAQAAGVKKFITIGTEPSDHEVVLQLAQKYAPHVYCTLGVHPHEGVLYDDKVERFLNENLHRKEVVAVGEIGLDYHYNQSPKEKQLEAFERQLELAKKFKLPVEIHTRDAEEDTVLMLKKFDGQVRGVIHCFTGTAELAIKCLDLGFNISISGVVTFKNAESLRSIVKDIVPSGAFTH